MSSRQATVASLSMYLRPETVEAYRAFWELVRDDLRRNGVAAPDRLTSNGVGYDFWRHPGLMLSQTCGYPYRSVLRDHVNLVGTPDYGLKGCPAGHYYSVFIVHRDSRFKALDELNNHPAAFNDDQSQSGYHGPRAYTASQGISLQMSVETGGHLKSVNAVVNRDADVAAIDVITWLDCQRYDPHVSSKLRVIAKTPSVPSLPLICAKAIDASLVLKSVSTITQQLDGTMKDVLRFQSIVQTLPTDYNEAQFAGAGVR